MRRTGKSKTCLGRWQERFLHEGVDGLLRDKTRPSRVGRLACFLVPGDHDGCVKVIGVDTAKRYFQVHGINVSGMVTTRRKISRDSFLKLLADLPSCLIGLEAGSGAHDWAREIARLGHDVRLMPPQQALSLGPPASAGVRSKLGIRLCPIRFRKSK